MNNKETSPFTPGCPVPVELFVGRSKQIEELLRYTKQILNGKQENIFLIGDRGIGKSSLSSFCRYYVATHEELNLLGVHVFLGRVSTLEEMVHHIFDQILKETKEQSWFKEVASFFGKYIEEIGLFGISVRFSPKEDDLKELVRNFPEVINNLLNKLKERKRGLFIALDDINGLAEKEDFANWYKSFVDEVATHYKNFPVVIVLIGQPEKRDSLSKLQPSLMRIFRIIEIEKLSDKEVSDFLTKAFSEKAGIKVSQEALETMVHFSSGLPIIMHEIGDATFWIDSDGIIDEKDAFKGVLAAAEKIGQKYLDPKVYREIRSLRYRSILRKIVNPPISRYFEKKHIESRLDTNEKRVFHNFLRKFRELGVIELDIEKGRGYYKFVNELYPVYIWMESERAKERK